MAATMSCYEFPEYRRRFIRALRSLGERVVDRDTAAHADELASRIETTGELPLGGERREAPEDHAVIFWAANVRLRANQRLRYWMACDRLETRIPRGEGEIIAALVQQHANMTTAWVLEKINELRDVTRNLWDRVGIVVVCDPETETYDMRLPDPVSQGGSAKPES